MTTQFDAATENAEATEVLGTIEYLDPEALTLEANDPRRRATRQGVPGQLARARRHRALNRSARHRGPHRRTREQCRTLGAREVGLARLPVFVLTETASKDADARTVERIVHQMVANDQRAALTEVQRARAIQTMLDTGVSPTKVAKLHRTTSSILVAPPKSTYCGRG